ncbi:MAG TPA: CDP-alcohol phosphatidyltransferase family protein [Herpetosiphonaceae bacterium]
MFSSNFKRWSREILQRIVRPTLGRLGLTPNMVTLIGFLLTMGVAAVLANGSLFAGGLLLLAAGFFDMLDGALARATDQASPFGAFFDSIMDRYSEAVVFFGLLIHYQIHAGSDNLLAIGLVYSAILGSIMVSYARARAEGLGFECETGWLGRPERVILLAFGLVSGWMMTALWILAVFTNLTAVQRIVHVWLAARRAEQAKNPQVKKSLFPFFEK